MVEQKGRALRLIFIIFLLVSVSNFLSTMAGYFSGKVGFHFLNSTLQNQIKFIDQLKPLWVLHWTNTITSGMALSLAVMIGAMFSYYSKPYYAKLVKKCNNLTFFCLDKFFVPLLPLFALGFILKMQEEGMFVSSSRYNVHHHILIA
jgi:hypothetical protein